MEDRANKITGEQKKDIHESNHEYLVKCYNNSLEIANKYKWKRVKCINGKTLRTVNDINNEIYEKVKGYI